MRLILFILAFTPLAALAQIVGTTGTSTRIVRIDNATTADSLLVKTSTNLLSAVHKGDLFGNRSAQRVALGFGAYALATTGTFGNAVGVESFRLTTTNTGNHGYGYQSGYNLAATAGNYNTFVGYRAGYNQVAGSNNLVLSASGWASTPINEGSFQLNIGNTIWGTNTNNPGSAHGLSTGGRIGIMLRTPLSTFHVGGSINGSADYIGSLFSPTINQSGTAGFSVLRVSPYLQAIGSGVKYLVDIGTNSADTGAGTHTRLFSINTDGNVGVGVTTTTAKLHLPASGGSASGAPLKIDAGSLLATPEAGTLEYDGVNYYLTSGSGARATVQVTRALEFNGATVSLTATQYTHYSFTGTTTTMTLPPVAGNKNFRMTIKNKGSGIITLNSNTGGNDIYNTAPVATISINPGESYDIVNDGVHYTIN